MGAKVRRLAGAGMALAVAGLAAAALAAASPPALPVGQHGKIQKVGQSTPGQARPAPAAAHARGWLLTATLTAPDGPAGARGTFVGLLVHTGPGTVHAGVLPFAPGCTILAPGGGFQPGLRGRGVANRIVCGGIPAFPVTPGVHWILGWRLTYSGLSGPATGATVRTGAPGAAGVLVASLCTQCTSGTFGHREITADQAAALLDGKGFVSVSTVEHPGGEISGQIVEKPVAALRANAARR